MFQLTTEEKAEVVANCDHLRPLKYSSNLPYAFTEHGAIMLASVLNSESAINAGIFAVRAFVRLREFLAANVELAIKFKELESKITQHDDEIKTLFEAISQLMAPPEKPKREIGFQVKGNIMRYNASKRIKR